MAYPAMDLHKRKRECEDSSFQQPGSVTVHQSPQHSPRPPQHSPHPPPLPHSQHHHQPYQPHHPHHSPQLHQPHQPYQQHQSHHHQHHQQQHQPQPQQRTTLTPVQDSPGFINYLPRIGSERLALIHGDTDTFNDILNLMADYEGVIDRQESLASNLGAKLTGARLLKGIERFFDGPIKTNSPQPFSNPITWIDVVTFAKVNPNDFTLTVGPGGTRYCQFPCKGLQVEISEDDWRIITSGALDRFPLEHPFEEDEAAELATLEILEQRTSLLYRKADDVAARARILHHRLGNRKHDIARRRQNLGAGSSRSQATNYPQRNSPHGPPFDLYADLMQQFTAAPAVGSPSRSTSGAGLSVGSLGPLSPSLNSPYNRASGLSGRSSTGNVTDPGPQSAANIRAETIRPLITQRTDKIHKGEVITPPCDRCRRLRLQCVKHLTACQGCTKKHAKCSWGTVTDEEMARLKRELGVLEDGEGAMEKEFVDRAQGNLTPAIPKNELTSRPDSRTDTDTSMPLVRSPDPMQGSRSDMRPEPPRRPSLPLGPGLGPALGSGLASIPRDQLRLNNVSSILTDSAYDRPPPGHGSILPPPSR